MMTKINKQLKKKGQRQCLAKRQPLITLYYKYFQCPPKLKSENALRMSDGWGGMGSWKGQRQGHVGRQKPQNPLLYNTQRDTA